MEIDNLPEKVKKAKDAVADLEEPLKTEAFKKILDKLLEPDISQASPVCAVPQDTNAVDDLSIKSKKSKSNKKVKPNKSNAKAKEEADKRKRELAEKINRTEYPEIHKLNSSLAKALYVLKIMREKGADGLTPPEISFILKEVFRIKASKELISVSLNRNEAHRSVDRSRIIIGRTVAYVYKLMKGGEDYLEEELKKINNHITKAGEGKEPD